VKYGVKLLKDLSYTFFEATESTVPAMLEPENSRKINDKISAGGRPTIEQTRWLKDKVGIKSIVNFVLHPICQDIFYALKL
jgi:hypothetical protein